VKAHDFKTKNLSAMCFFYAYFISGGILAEIFYGANLQIEGGRIMPAYKDEKSGKWFASFYYKDWDGQSRKKLKRGFETKKEAVAYERNFTVKMYGSLNMLFEDYFELYKADIIGTIRLIHG